MDMGVSVNRPDPEFWKTFLNDRAAELGLDKSVKMVKGREIAEVTTWAYEVGDGSLVDLGWDVESAEASLRDLAGA